MDYGTIFSFLFLLFSFYHVFRLSRISTTQKILCADLATSYNKIFQDQIIVPLSRYAHMPFPPEMKFTLAAEHFTTITDDYKLSKETVLNYLTRSYRLYLIVALIVIAVSFFLFYEKISTNGFLSAGCSVIVTGYLLSSLRWFMIKKDLLIDLEKQEGSQHDRIFEQFQRLYFDTKKS